jgi:hypothetical protein
MILMTTACLRAARARTARGTVRANLPPVSMDTSLIVRRRRRREPRESFPWPAAFAPAGA